MPYRFSTDRKVTVNGREYGKGDAVPKLPDALESQLEKAGVIASDKPIAEEKKK